MVSLDELRSIVLSLPETSEGTHFRRPVYRVADRPIIAVEKDQSHVTVRLDKEVIQSLVKKDPMLFEEIWQNGKHLIGVRFELTKVSREKIQQIVQQSWLSKAPKKLIKSSDNR